ncbi:MAG: DUF4157 domain-containing protein [Anaerolineae bacterium]|nr:DUF4157 domain-containing protein [Gemmatimonadaceae bacterium]
MGLLAVIRAAVVGDAMDLPSHILTDFPDLAAASYRRGGLPVRVGGWALGQRTACAITLWNTVFLAPDTHATAELLLHELQHVYQFQASRAFPFLYLWESLRRGYSHNRFEVDANAFAEARLSSLPSALRQGDT